jgi:NADPH2:quinone reductase
MHAVVQHEFGPPANLRFEEVPDPVPGTDQVRIAVALAGVHLVDTMIRRGGPGPMPPSGLPMIPGREVAGTVDAIGPGVDARWLGRRVVAHLGLASGGYAELAVASVDALHEIGDDLSAEAAVAMIGTGRTTMGILDVAQLVADDVALVTAAAGGIGSLLVQAGRNAGAAVVGLAGGPEKVARVRDLGANFAIDDRDPVWTDAVREQLDGRDITVAFDGVGGAVGRGALDVLGIGGRLVMYGFASGSATEFSAMDLFARGLTVTVAVGPRVLRRPGGMRELEERALAAAASGELVPLVAQRYPLREAAAAHTALETRASVGKVVLVP